MGICGGLVMDGFLEHASRRRNNRGRQARNSNRYATPAFGPKINTSTVPPFSFEKTEVGKQEPTGKHPDLGGPERGKVKKSIGF